MRHKIVRFLTLLVLLPVLPILGALRVKPIEASTQKYAENAARSAEEYATNAEAAAEDWARKGAAAAETFHAAVTASGVKERFRRGIQRAGSAKYARKIRDVARDRYGPGVSAGSEDYKTGAQPYYETIAGLTLSSRKPRGDPANYNRVMEVGKALNAKRLALLGASAGG